MSTMHFLRIIFGLLSPAILVSCKSLGGGSGSRVENVPVTVFKPNATADVVFVHGVEGNLRSTWHPANRADLYWPTWVGNENREWNVMTVGYPAATTTFTGNSMGLINRATNLLSVLTSRKVGQRPIAFVCHSFGGLVVKEMLRQASASQDSRYRAIFDNTKGVVFLSTPHTGTDLTYWLEYFKAILGTTELAKDVENSNPYLLQLNQWYIDQSARPDNHIQTQAFYENEATFGVKVVGAASGAINIPNVLSIPLDANHFSICKPESPQASPVVEVNQFLSNVLPSNEAPADTAAPIGTIIAFGGPAGTEPKGWLPCNGRPLDLRKPNEKRYAALAKILGKSWGDGGSNSVDTFNVPDLRGVFLRGDDTDQSYPMSDAWKDPDRQSRTWYDGKTRPAGVGSYQLDGFKGHIHSVRLGEITLREGGGNVAGSIRNIPNGPAHNYFGAPFEDSSDPRGGAETRPKNAAVLFIIKAE